MSTTTKPLPDLVQLEIVAKARMLKNYISYLESKWCTMRPTTKEARALREAKARLQDLLDSADEMEMEI